ncbi:MAG: hypothetical protein LC105_06065 [Chitinophagales bacterium]|nr:hypothetical protein [Chitinophagales bacterium]
MKIILHIQTKGADAVMEATYKNGRFHSLQHKRGNLSDKQFHSLMTVVPRYADQLEKFREKYQDRIIYTTEDNISPSLFQAMIESYFTWYHQRTGIEPRINGTSGMHLNQIIAYLRKVSVDDTEVTLVFKLILDRWDELPEFYRGQIEIRQINSNLNILLNHVKNGTSTDQSRAKSVSNDFRASI